MRIRHSIIAVALALGLSACSTGPADSGVTLADAPRTQCTPVDGWDAVLATRSERYLVIGEIHGTGETPLLVADIVCLTARSGSVTVALELPESDQALLDAFIQSDGGQAASAAFLATSFWSNPVKDGRSSEAMFALVDRLRQYHDAGLVRRVVAFQPTSGENLNSPEAYERTMAEIITAASQDTERTIVYVGNTHALRQEVEYRGGYMPMAGHLPSASTLTFDTTGNGGETWACSTMEECGPMSLGTNPSPRARGVEMAADADTARYSGIIYLGTVTTPSPPRVPIEDQP